VHVTKFGHEKKHSTDRATGLEFSLDRRKNQSTRSSVEWVMSKTAVLFMRLCCDASLHISFEVISYIKSMSKKELC